MLFVLPERFAAHTSIAAALATGDRVGSRSVVEVLWRNEALALLVVAVNPERTWRAGFQCLVCVHGHLLNRKHLLEMEQTKVIAALHGEALWVFQSRFGS